MEPTDRVTAFIAAWHERWAAVSPLFADRESGDHRERFATWNEALTQVSGAHWTSPAGLQTGSFSSSPDHDPALERIIDSSIDTEGTTARVLTQTTRGPLEQFHEYHLVHHGDDWRIANLRILLSHPDSPAVAPQVADAARTAASGTATPQISGGLPDLAALWTDGRVTHLPQPQADPDDPNPTPARRVALQVLDIGTIEVGEHGLAVLDLAYDIYRLAPLAWAPPPGRYPVQVSVAAVDRGNGRGPDARVAGVRVRFGPATHRWAPAERADESGHVVGVDSGSAAIVDLDALLETTYSQKEGLFEAFTRQPDPGVLVGPVGASPETAVITRSGWGDGGYPVYWGVSSDGQPSELVIDYLVLAQEIPTVARVPWSQVGLSAPELDDLGAHLTLRKGERTSPFFGKRRWSLEGTGPLPREGSLVGPDLSTIAPLSPVPHTDDPTRWSAPFTLATDPPAGSTIMLRFASGYRLV